MITNYGCRTSTPARPITTAWISRSWAFGVLGTFAVGLLLVGLATPAQAGPVRPTLGSVTAQLSRLGRDSERLSEAYNRAAIDVTTRQRELKLATAKARAASSTYRKSVSAVRGD